MALSEQEKQALEEHFRGKELYDPSKDLEQQTADYAPRCMCGGGHVLGMCDGGMARGGIAIKPSHKGKLHEKLGVPQDQPIPAKKIAKAENSKSPALRKEAQFAENAKHWQHKAKGGTIQPTKNGPIKLDDGGAVMEQGPLDQIDQGDTNSIDQGEYPIPDKLIQGPQDAPPLAISPQSMADADQTINQTLPTVPAALQLTAQNMPAAPSGSAEAPMVAAAAPKPQAPMVDAMADTTPAAQSQTQPQIAPSTANIAPDQFDELIKALEQKPSGGQYAMRGLAALADGIMQGVARAGNPGFEKGIEESQQAQRQQLIDALRAKYETGFKGLELQQGAKRLQADIANQQAQRALEERGQNLNAINEARQRQLQAGELGMNAQKARVDAAQKVVDAYEKGYKILGRLGLEAVPSEAEYNQAKHIIENNGAAITPSSGGWSIRRLPNG